MIRDENLVKEIAEYNRLFAEAFKQYGNSERWPFIVEQSITDDMQLLELLEMQREKVVKLIGGRWPR